LQRRSAPRLAEQAQDFEVQPDQRHQQSERGVPLHVLRRALFGDIISDLCAGLVGGLGLAPGANIGVNAAIFEAVHGSAPDIAGKGIANPVALLLGAIQMLEHLGKQAEANRLRAAIVATMQAKDDLTPDLGGKGTTQSFAESIAERL
jgi:isocitrate dehydrogenase (NAD+)